MTILWGKVQLRNLILKWRSWGINRLYNFNITLLNEGQNWYWKLQNMCSLYNASHYIVISHFGKTYWIFVPQMSLKNTYKILINYFMILVKPLTPLMPKSFVLFFFTSNCLSSTQIINELLHSQEMNTEVTMLSRKHLIVLLNSYLPGS